MVGGTDSRQAGKQRERRGEQEGKGGRKVGRAPLKGNKVNVHKKCS